MHRRGGQPDMGDQRAARKPDRGIDKNQGQGEEAGEPGQAVPAEVQRRRFDADQNVVVLVLVGIDRVIGQRPEDAAEI